MWSARSWARAASSRSRSSNIGRSTTSVQPSARSCEENSSCLWCFRGQGDGLALGAFPFESSHRQQVPWLFQARKVMPSFTVRPLTPADRDWVARHIADRWGAEIVVAHGVVYRPAELPGFAAVQDEDVAGLVTYNIEGDACEIVTIDSSHPGLGIGTALIEAVECAAIASGCRRLWLITTNDNLHALGFYQKRGFRLVALRPGAVDRARKLKTEIPETGNDGIPIRDEIELEIAPLSGSRRVVLR